MSVAIWDGNLYTLIIIEISCYYLVGQLLKNKNKVRVAVQDIILILEC